MTPTKANTAFLPIIMYDASGRVTECRNLTKNYTLTFNYSADGMHLDVMKDDGTGAVLFDEIDYDGRGHIVRRVRHSTYDSIDTWTYDDSGRLLERATEYATRTEKRIYEYDKYGFLVQDSSPDEDSGEVISYFYVLNEYGDMLEWHLIRDNTASGGEKEDYRVRLNEYNDH